MFFRFKPVGLQWLLEQLKTDYLDLFEKTFPMKKNNGDFFPGGRKKRIGIYV